MTKREVEDITLLPHVIVCGDPGEGFTLYGPFDTYMEASEHMDNDGNLPDHDWWLMPVYGVDQESPLKAWDDKIADLFNHGLNDDEIGEQFTAEQACHLIRDYATRLRKRLA